MKIGDLVKGRPPGWNPAKIGLVVEDKVENMPSHIVVRFLNRFVVMHVHDAVLIQGRDSHESR